MIFMKMPSRLSIAHARPFTSPMTPLLAVGLLVLSACGAPPPPVSQPVLPPPVASEQDKAPEEVVNTDTTQAPVADAAPAASADNNSDVTDEAVPTEADNSSDVVGSIIWELEQSQQTPAPAPPAALEDVIPEGEDPALAKEALDAALALLGRAKSDAASAPYQLPEKPEGATHIGVFLPQTGPAKPFGDAIRDGLLLAYFQIAPANSRVIYFDSELALEELAAQVVEAEIDVIIGPLFSERASRLHLLLADHDIPILSLSNNQNIARPGLFTTGAIPEQQLDLGLGAALSAGYEDFAILAQDNAYGQQMTGHMIDRLTAFGMTPSHVRTITAEMLSDDDRLVPQIKAFARYEPLEDGELLDDKPAPYDAVYIAGDSSFVLRIAPLLAYYDLGPDRALFLGTDLWANPALVREPSLQGAFITTIKPELTRAFAARHDAHFDSMPSFLSQLGFDVMAVALQGLEKSGKSEGQQTAGIEAPLLSALVTDQGFSGYTGTFKLLPSGVNYRGYDSYIIEGGALVAKPLMPKADLGDN